MSYCWTFISFEDCIFAGISQTTKYENAAVYSFDIAFCKSDSELKCFMTCTWLREIN